MLATILTLISACIMSYGAFSRLTHGEYTPEFYAYQLDRAPDNDQTWFIPYLDLVIASMMLLPRSRKTGLESSILFQALGLVMRIGAGKDILYDVGLVALSAGGLLALRSGW